MAQENKDIKELFKANKAVTEDVILRAHTQALIDNEEFDLNKKKDELKKIELLHLAEEYLAKLREAEEYKGKYNEFLNFFKKREKQTMTLSSITAKEEMMSNQMRVINKFIVSYLPQLEREKEDVNIFSSLAKGTDEEKVINGAKAVKVLVYKLALQKAFENSEFSALDMDTILETLANLDIDTTKEVAHVKAKKVSYRYELKGVFERKRKDFPKGEELKKQIYDAMESSIGTAVKHNTVSEDNEELSFFYTRTKAIKLIEEYTEKIYQDTIDNPLPYGRECENGAQAVNVYFDKNNRSKGSKPKYSVLDKLVLECGIVKLLNEEKLNNL